jgi:hypothetical protein
MAHPAKSAQSSPLVSDVSLRDVLRRELHRAINVEKTFTRGGLASECGVSTDVIDSIISRDPAKHRRLKMEDVFSLVAVLGSRAVNALTAVISYGAYHLDESGEPDLADIVADGLGHMAIIAAALSDGRIDPHEEGPVQDAADRLMDKITPISSRHIAASS